MKSNKMERTDFIKNKNGTEENLKRRFSPYILYDFSYPTYSQIHIDFEEKKIAAYQWYCRLV